MTSLPSSDLTSRSRPAMAGEPHPSPTAGMAGATPAEDADDRLLVSTAARGDHAAFSILVQRHYGRAIRVAYGLLRSREDAEDVVQEAFVRAHARLAEFRAASGFYTWLYRIVVNLSIDLMRKRRRERRVDVEDDDCRDALGRGRQLWPVPDRTNPFRNVEIDQLRVRIQLAFAELPEIHRAVILLREVEGMSYEEISHALGIKKGTVMSRLFHARRSMQKLIAGDELEADADVKLGEHWLVLLHPETASVH